MNTPDRSSARKQRRDHNSPYSRKASKPKAALDPLPTLASSSSFRNLYNFVSSPFRSRAAPPPPQDESDEEEEEDEDEEDGVQDRPVELGDSDEDMDQQQAGSSWKGKGRETEGNHSGGGLTRSSASTNLSSLPPLPNPNSSKWISALAPSSTHAHALVQMAPSSQVSQPRYAKQPMGPPPPPPPRGGAAGISRSQTLSSLQPGASNSSDSASTSTRAELILERFLAEKGLSEEDEREVRELMVKKGRESQVPPPPSNHSTTYNPPLFHPGTSATRLAASTSTNTLANSRLARSTSTMSFLSPSRSSSSSQLSSSSSSRQLSARASSPGAFSSPGKRRPIYLGPGVSHSPSRSKRNVTFGGLDLKPSVVVQSPGKKRRVEDDREDDDMDVERELSGLGSSSSSGRGLNSSQSVPSFLNSAPASPSSPSAPFTFSIPFSPSSTSTNTNNSYSQPAALSPSPARALAPPPPPAPVVKPSQSLSSGLSRYSRHPSLVAPSPLRQSTSFADSPESVKSAGGSPAGSPLGAKGAGGAGAGAARSKASSMMLDFIQEEEVAKRVASPTPISNPYQSAGLASPSPRRNPRRSVAAETRSSRAATPRKGANGDGLKVPTALELIEKEAQKESMNSPTPTSKKQKSSATSSSNTNGFSLNGPATPSRPSASPAPPNDTSTTPTSAPPSKRKAPTEDTPPSWMTDVQPPTVIFAHDAFGGPIFGSGSKKSTTSFGASEDTNQDSEMDVSTSPAKSTTKLFSSSVDSREKIVEKDFGKKPSFAFDTAIVSSPSSKKSALPSESPSTRTSANPTPSSLSKLSDPKTIALETDRVLLPNFTFIFSSITTPLPTSSLESQAISEVTKLPASSLPKFDLLAPPPSASTSTSTGGFNWASAGLAPPPKPSADIWTCETCGTKSPVAKEKCIACEEPRPAQKKTSPSSSNAPAPVVGGFNWASAGMAPPPKPSSDIWTCDVCGTKSPLDKAKCIACEEPRPVQKSTPSTPAPVVATGGGFNWAASGFAPPPAPSSDVWVCGDCGTKSPKEKEKCIACEAPNPTKKSTSAPVVGGGGGGFNWGAAGMKVPEKKAGWDCGVCMIRNGEERTKCASCETERS